MGQKGMERIHFVQDKDCRTQFTSEIIIRADYQECTAGMDFNTAFRT
jgi:hypothetical protein